MTPARQAFSNSDVRATVEESQKLMDQLRELRGQMRKNATDLRDSAVLLASSLQAAMTGSLVRTPSAPAPVTPSSAPAPVLDPKDEERLNSLTSRELEVLRLIGEGQRTKEIAFALGISFKTAVTHRSNIMEKLGIHEGPRLVRFAIRTGITTP